MLDLDDERVEPPPLRPPLANTSSPSDKEPDGDLEKIRKWQEERIARKLRGEYESSVMHLTELVRVLLHLADWCDVLIYPGLRFRTTLPLLYTLRLCESKAPTAQENPSSVPSSDTIWETLIPTTNLPYKQYYSRLEISDTLYKRLDYSTT